MPTYPEILAKMFDLQKFGMKFGLNSMAKILEKLGNPHRGRKFVHVAGTNGKGSTAVMLASILTRAGVDSGLYTSPHLVTFRERIRRGGQMISEADVAKMSEEVWPATDPDSPPTFFEFVTAMALSWFKGQGVEISVIETGLGGRLDSTNLIDPMAAAITNVSLEHVDHLGDTVAKIAFEKAGIIKAGVPLVLGAVNGEALGVIEAKAKEAASGPISLFGRDFKAFLTGSDSSGRPVFDYYGKNLTLKGVRPSLAGPCQVENAAVALALAEVLSSLPGGPEISPEAALGGISEAVWPGRAETFPAGSWPPPEKSAQAPLLLDGAHNPAGAEALAALLREARFQKLHLVLGVMADKDVPAVLAPILPLAGRLYLTRPKYHRAEDPQKLLQRIEASLGRPAAETELFAELPQAIRAASKAASPSDLAVVSGSLFTVGEARAFLTGIDSVESN
ncbi:MAG: bifunctional folylpolyglutamate synthase/dihydrofolate synthase [Deltaproteobacteria bacterium]|jgi:dihydrofolate synthase/folylpolyglutamate synthase|nr:bifunctional folylpolyglutamate synthase/dihydrofolate synthase [Deltaproteobacteria bacterium]